MSKWILIIFIAYGPNDTEIEQVEFQSRALCQGASPVIIEEYRSILDERSTVKGICIQTAREIPE